MDDLQFRPLSPADLPGLSVLVSDWNVVRQLGRWPWPPDPAFTASRCDAYAGNDGFVWGVLRGGDLIGSIGVTGGQLGYMFRLDTAGQGIATRAARIALAQAFAHPATTSIRASSWADNPASARVLQKCGFVHWQTRYDAAFARRRPVLLHNHRLTRAAWQRLSNAR